MALQSKLFIQKRSATTSLKQPKELGFYSKSSKHEFLIQDASRLAYYYFPDAQLEKNFDLTSGIKKFKECTNNPDFDNNSLHGLLATIQAYEERKQKKLRASIVTFRGVMRKLISAAFDNPKYVNVNLRVVAFDGQLFIKEVGDNASKQPSNKNTDSVECRSYYSGYKFETLTTLSTPFADTPRSVIEKRHSKLVNNGDQYITVVKTGIGKCKMILGAEVDCVFDFKEEAADNLKHYAELKCTKGVTTLAEARAFERKIFKTWIQCFLVGINRIIYGFRDDHFILRSVEEFTTQEIPLLLKNNPQLYNACLDAIKWYGAFTEWLIATIPEANCTEIKAYSLTFEHNHLKLTEMTDKHEEYKDIIENEGVLSTKFKEWRTSLAQREECGQ